MKLTDIDQQLSPDSAAATDPEFTPGEIIIGEFNGLNDQGEPLVNYNGNPSQHFLTAISTVALTQHQSGRQVAMLFAEGNPEKPVIVGLIHSPLYEMIENFEITPAEAEAPEARAQEPQSSGAPQKEDAYLDGKRVVLEAQEEIVFKCGEASITLTKAGKILIRGKYILNRSSGVNRIQGGSVQVN